MSSNHIRSLEQLRKVRNRELVNRMRKGESTTSYDSFASWFPPRPKIEKDPSALQALYGIAESVGIAEVTAARKRAKEETGIVKALPKAD